jgi:hypothetical protein
MTYSERLRALKLPLLSYQRLRGDMIEVPVYKILNGKYDPRCVTIFSGRLFQYLTTLIANEYFLSCVLALWG